MQPCGLSIFDSTRVSLSLHPVYLAACEYLSAFLVLPSEILFIIWLLKNGFRSVHVLLLVHLTEQDSLQTFLLLGESERDNRLLSRSQPELASNEKQEQVMLKDIPTKSPRVVCNLERAQWEKV
jgi:hypothetical protein